MGGSCTNWYCSSLSCEPDASELVVLAAEDILLELELPFEKNESTSSEVTRLCFLRPALASSREPFPALEASSAFPPAPPACTLVGRKKHSVRAGDWSERKKHQLWHSDGHC